MEYYNEKLGEKYIYSKHKSGLDVFVVKKKGFSKYYATFATKYGSMDSEFYVDGKKITVPDGIAHFLEHKMFDSQGESVSDMFAKNGANDNAFTSFDKTAYVFSCTDKFYENLKILLDYVSDPYFTDETVEKEQGIIGQEIKMYCDSPDWQVLFGLLQALYINNPVKIDIAGTVESIAQIDKDILYKCYNAFYNLNNMVLVVVGDVDEKKVYDVMDGCLKQAEGFTTKKAEIIEPNEINQSYIEKKLSVSIPMFYLGFKETDNKNGCDMVKNSIASDILTNLICGDSTPLYKRLYDSGLINQNFSIGYDGGAGFGITLFTGESSDCKKVCDEILNEIERLKREGIDKTEFDRCKNALYGQFLHRFNVIERVGNYFVSCYVNGYSPFDTIKAYEEIDIEFVTERLLKHFVKERSALSVIKPL